MVAGEDELRQAFLQKLAGVRSIRTVPICHQEEHFVLVPSERIDHKARVLIFLYSFQRIIPRARPFRPRHRKRSRRAGFVDGCVEVALFLANSKCTQLVFVFSAVSCKEVEGKGETVTEMRV